jgi:predicted transposase YdaD
MPDAKSPHDALFKKVFSNASHAADALRTALPAQVAKHIDWQSLALVIYCLFEH